MRKKIYQGTGTGLNISLHPSGPKWDIRCGNPECRRTWRDRIGRLNNPTLECPTCHQLTQLNIAWE